MRLANLELAFLLFMQCMIFSCARFGPVHQASLDGNAANVKSLLAEGYSANSKDQFGENPLAYALNTKVAGLLIAAGAEVNSSDLEGRTPIFFARSPDIAKLLLANGASIGISSRKFGTPLYFYTLNNKPELMDVLLQAGANPNDGADDFTPLHLAAQRGYIEAARILLHHGANLNALTRGPDSQSVMDQAKRWNQAAMIEFLRSQGARN